MKVGARQCYSEFLDWGISVVPGEIIDFTDLWNARIGNLVSRNAEKTVYHLYFDNNIWALSTITHYTKKGILGVMRHPRHLQYNQITFLKTEWLSRLIREWRIWKYQIESMGSWYNSSFDTKVLKMSHMWIKYFWILNTWTWEFAVKKFNEESHWVHFQK